MALSKLEVIFCIFLAGNNFVNALILFIRARTTQQNEDVDRGLCPIHRDPRIPG